MKHLLENEFDLPLARKERTMSFPEGFSRISEVKVESFLSLAMERNQSISDL